MNNFNKSIAFFAFGLLIFSCNKREIIPAPEPKVELKNHFFGKVQGSPVELTQNVNGFKGSSGVDLVINASALDSAVYHSVFSSTSSMQSISIGHGSLIFDWEATQKPSMSIFESFFLPLVNQQLPYASNGLTGFSVKYTDGSGRVWKSNNNGSYINENASYSTMSMGSDSSGDYAKFRLGFDTYVYRTYLDPVTSTNVTDSILITDAVYTGWYRR